MTQVHENMMLYKILLCLRRNVISPTITKYSAIIDGMNIREIGISHQNLLSSNVSAIEIQYSDERKWPNPNAKNILK
jgi:hypothetical protein